MTGGERGVGLRRLRAAAGQLRCRGWRTQGYWVPLVMSERKHGMRLWGA